MPRSFGQRSHSCLQRIETYNGLVILGSNPANHVDEALARRFERLVPMPRQSERLLVSREGGLMIASERSSAAC